MDMGEFITMFSVSMAIGFGLSAIAGWIGYSVRGFLGVLDTHK